MTEDRLELVKEELGLKSAIMDKVAEPYSGETIR